MGKYGGEEIERKTETQFLGLMGLCKDSDFHSEWNGRPAKSSSKDMGWPALPFQQSHIQQSYCEQTEELKDGDSQAGAALQARGMQPWPEQQQRMVR